MKSSEEIFINALQKSNVCACLNDDVFYLKAGLQNFVVAMDGFCQSVHFKSQWLSPAKAARKAFLVNLSDIIAKNAKPKFAIVSVVLPKNFKANQILEIADSISKICKSWGVQILGGDTMSGTSLEFHITMIAKVNDKFLPRKVKKTGLSIFATQDRIHKIGGSLKNLNALLRFENSRASGRFLEPKLRSDFVKESAKFIASSMDLSDGLAQDLPKMLGNFGARFSKSFKKIMRFQSFRIQSGEEYEILFCAGAGHRAALQNLAKKHRIQLLEIGKTTRGRLKLNCKKWH